MRKHDLKTIITLAALFSAIFSLPDASMPSDEVSFFSPVSAVRAEEKDSSFAYAEIKATLAEEKNFVHFNRLSGMLTDLLREQKRLFHEKGMKEPNETAARMEDLLNEAGLYASQGMYDECYQVLGNAFSMITASIEETRQ